MKFISKYTAIPPNAQGFVNYSATENTVWQTLYTRQIKLLPRHACDEFIDGLHLLNLTIDNIPQLPEVSKVLYDLTGWRVQAVAALISAKEFFQLLAQRQFPAATFIRYPEQLNYVQEPDIFHELFGHCPMLTNKIYADFIYQYACLVLKTPEAQWPLLQRLFWFTVEFGLIQTPDGLRAYGGGILSSIQETSYSVTSDLPMRVLFHPLTALRTPYRIDNLQLIYFVINSYQSLYDLIIDNMQEYIQKAYQLGEYPPLFKLEPNNPNIHILAC